ncbi:MAG: glycosyl transferase group 1 [Humibacillus sp.]|nr:glycosyl transferase group 1 [Humibacillus sp.]
MVPRAALSPAAELAGASALGVVLTAAAGRRAEADALLTLRTGTATGRSRRRALAAGAAAGLGTQAVLDDSDETAYVLQTRGHLLRARDEIAHHRGPLAARHRRWLDGHAAVLRGVALEPLTHGPSSPASACTGRGPVLHVVTNALPDVQAGYTIRTHGILRAQAAAGRPVAAVTPPGYPVAQGRLAAGETATLDGIRYLRSLPPRVTADPAAPDRALVAHVESVVQRAVELRAEVLHAHSNHVNAQAALIAGRRLDVPVVYEVRGLLEETWRARGGDPTSEFYRWTRATETRCLELASAVVTLSRPLREEIVARGIDPSRVHVVPNGVDDDLLTTRPDGDALRRRLGIDPDAVVIGTVSTLNRYEGIDLLVASAAVLDDPRLVVLVVGDGPELHTLQQAADRLRADVVRTRVVLTARLSRTDALAAQAGIDVFCVPRRDTRVTRLVAPLKPVEAMALGRPVVASDLPPLSELLGLAPTDTGPSTHTGPFAGPAPRGVLVAPGNLAALAAALGALADEPARRVALGEAGRAHVRAHRTWGAAAQTYAGIYASLTQSPSVHPGLAS